MAQLPTTKCQLCSKNNGSVFCYECKQALCITCQNVHEKIPLTKNHKVTDLNKVDRLVFQTVNECATHKENFIYYCAACKCLICRVCPLTTHKDHKFAGIDAVTKEARQDIKSIIKQGKAKLAQVEKVISEIDPALMAKVEREGKNKTESIKTSTTVLREIIKIIEETKINDVDVFMHIETEQLKISLKASEKLRDEYKDFIATLEQLQEETHDATFLALYFKNKNAFNQQDEIPNYKQPDPIGTFDFTDFFLEVINRTSERFDWDKVETKSEEILKTDEEMTNLKKMVDQLRAHADRIEAKIESLSQIAGSKMTDGNPAIADQGDPNRPTKLGEKFSELYDNEWTDAMEELDKSGDDKTNINTLRTIVERAYEFGKTRSGAFMKDLEKSLMSLSNSIQVTPAISKLIKELRKNIASLVTEEIYQAFLGNHTEITVGGENVKSFIRKTVGLCWFMAIQDPPVVLITKVSGKLDTDRFRYYTQSGTTVDYVVWPVVYLHEGGPIICKGVAQGK